MALVAVSAVVLALFSREVQRRNRELASMATLSHPGVSFGHRDRLPAWLRKLVGNTRLTSFYVVDGVSFPPDGSHVYISADASAHVLGITDAELAEMRPALEQLPYLEHIELNSSRITDEGLLHLRGLNSLRLLNIANTAVTPEGIAAPRQHQKAVAVFK